jgi:hypothetical protein
VRPMNPEVILEAIEVHASEMRAVSGERTTVRSKLSTYKRFFFLLLKLIWGYRWVNPCCHRAIRGTKFSWSWSLVMIVRAVDRRCSGLSLVGTRQDRRRDRFQRSTILLARIERRAWEGVPNRVRHAKGSVHVLMFSVA